MVQRLSRMKKELEMLTKDPPFGVSCWSQGGKLNCLEARLQGPQGTPYEGGIFKLEINIPERYPFEPPQIKFLTKIYHPNIDTAGRICLDVLKALPQGSWKPAHNISTVLTSIQLLLSEPNPDDGLMADISSEYKHNRPSFEGKAKEWVSMYAKDGAVPVSAVTTNKAPFPIVHKDSSPSTHQTVPSTSSSRLSHCEHVQPCKERSAPEAILGKRKKSTDVQHRLMTAANKKHCPDK